MPSASAAAAAMKLKNKGSVTVQVVVRCRPLNKKELGEDRKPIITIDENQVSIVKGIGKDNHIMSDEEKKATKKSFTFDAAYDEQSTQKQFYEESCYPLVESVMEGFNGTIFAYGQTGCGKTWTMMGPPSPLELRGVIPSSFDHIFENIKTTTDCEFLVRCSYLEIYNECIYDLCNNKKVLKARMQKNDEFALPGIKEIPVKNSKELAEVQEMGESAKSMGVSNLNEHSSRSHCIFSITVESSPRIEAEEPEAEGGMKGAYKNILAGKWASADAALVGFIDGPGASDPDQLMLAVKLTEYLTGQVDGFLADMQACSDAGDFRRLRDGLATTGKGCVGLAAYDALAGGWAAAAMVLARSKAAKRHSLDASGAQQRSATPTQLPARHTSRT